MEGEVSVPVVLCVHTSCSFPLVGYEFFVHLYHDSMKTLKIETHESLRLHFSLQLILVGQFMVTYIRPDDQRVSLGRGTPIFIGTLGVVVVFFIRNNYKS